MSWDDPVYRQWRLSRLVLGSSPEGLSLRQTQERAIRKHMPSLRVDGKDDAYVAGMIEAIYRDLEREGKIE